MSHFFQPNSKVQKDRHVMRETDARMAKYSRRGLIFNFIAFLICLLGGTFVDENRELTVILASGLLLVTFLRGYYLFRFDQHYPRGPARWRNVYFVVTLLGAFWWGVILTSITLVMGLQDEAPLLWLYTIVFFSTTAHAFAPYHRFLSYYQFFGLVPAAGAAIIVGGWSGYIYGALMLMFYLILSHQCRLISDNYWEKLEAGYALSRRSSSEEAERSNSKTSIDLNQEFLVNLERKFDSLTSKGENKAGSSDLIELQKNIQLFRKIQAKDLRITARVFNVRHELQFIASEFIEHTEANDLHLETALSTNLPLRLKGDPAAFAQIVRTILDQVVSLSRTPNIIIEAQFLREYESAGELHITVKQERNKQTAIPFFTGAKKMESPQSIEFAIAKGLAELFGGELQVVEFSDHDFEIRFNCRMDIVDRAGHLDFHRGRFQGNKILFVTSSDVIASTKREELDALGFTTSVETQFKKVAASLAQQIKSGNAVENILIYHEPGNDSCIQLLDELKNTGELKGLNKIIATTESIQRQLRRTGFTEESGFYLVSKPLGLFELETTFDYMYTLKGDEAALRVCRNGTVIVVGDPKAATPLALNCELLPNQRVIKTPFEQLEKTLETAYNIMVVVPCSASVKPDAVLDVVRAFEAKHTDSETFIPVIGVGEEGFSCHDIAAFEIGFDDYIDLNTERGAMLTSTLRYWRSIAQ